MEAINSYNQGSAGGVYTARSGDTLAGIALQIWGDASLWYKLAAANGLSAASTLTEGQALRLPSGVQRSTFNAATLNPYDPASAIGDTSPTAAAPPKKNKCGVFGAILSAIVAVATALTFGAIPGNLISQGFNVLIGTQDRFSFKDFAIAALTAVVTAGISTVGQGAAAAAKAAGELGKSVSIFTKVGAFLGSSSIGAGVARGVLGSALSQGIGVATGLRSNFDWVGVAAAGIGAGVGGAVAGTQFAGSLGPFGGQLVVNTASGIANAATRSVLEGTSFGDNIIAALPDVIGQTVGGLVAARMAKGDTQVEQSQGGASGKIRFLRQPEDENGNLVDEKGVPLEADVVVIARRQVDGVIKKGRRFLGWLGDAIDSFTGFTNLGGHHPHRAQSTTVRFGPSDFFRPSTDAEIRRVTSGKSIDAPFNASQPSTVRNWVLMTRLGDNASGLVTSNLGKGSTFDRYVGSPISQAGSTIVDFYFGPGSVIDNTLNKPFYSVLGFVADSPLGDPGLIATLESNGLTRPIGAIGAGVRNVVALRRAVTATETITAPSIANQLGRAGEVVSAEVIGLPKNTIRIPSASGAKDYRIPDHLEPLDQLYIAETKNVKYQTLTSQISDDVAHVNRGGYPGRVDVIIDSRTTISGPLLREHLNPGSPIKIRTMDLNRR